MKHAVTLTLTGDMDVTGNGNRTRYEPITVIGTGDTFEQAVDEARSKLTRYTDAADVLLRHTLTPRQFDRTLESDLKEDR